jgi:hypothetical protein
MGSNNIISGRRSIVPRHHFYDRTSVIKLEQTISTENTFCPLQSIGHISSQNETAYYTDLYARTIRLDMLINLAFKHKKKYYRRNKE